MPVIAQWLILMVVSLAVSWLLRPKANKSPQASLDPPGEAEMPTVDEGVEIPVIFGVVWSGNSTVVWWGDTHIETRTYEEQVQT